MVHDHQLAHLTGRQRRCLARLGDEQQLVLGVHRLGILAPTPPELATEGHAEVDAAAHPEVLQRGDPHEGPRHGGDIEGDVGAETLAHEHHARATLRRDRLQALLDRLKHVARKCDAVEGLGHRQGTRHERVLRHDRRAVAAGEVFECFSDGVVDVADTGRARDADERAFETTAGLEIGDAERRALAQIIGRLVSAHHAHRIDRGLAHDLRDLVVGERHGDEATPLLADGVEGHVAARTRRDVRVARRLGVGGLDDVVAVLEPVCHPLEGIGTGQAHRAEDRGVPDEGARGTGIAADGSPHEALQAMGGHLLADDERGQPDEARDSDAGRREERSRVDTLDPMVVRIDAAVLVRAAYGEVDIARRDRRSRQDIGHESRVESGAQVQALVEYVVPQ